MKKCANCDNELHGWVRPWHQCHRCGKEFCGLCGDKLIDKTLRCQGCRSVKLDVRSIL